MATSQMAIINHGALQAGKRVDAVLLKTASALDKFSRSMDAPSYSCEHRLCQNPALLSMRYQPKVGVVAR